MVLVAGEPGIMPTFQVKITSAKLLSSVVGKADAFAVVQLGPNELHRTKKSTRFVSLVDSFEQFPFFAQFSAPHST